MELSLLGVFVVGLFSTLHCVGMCGGIVGALTYSLPAEIRDSRWRLSPYILAYNLGRISSYTLAGALVGGFSQTFFDRLFPDLGHLLLQGLAFIMMVSIGLYLAGWFPDFARIEHLGGPVWRRLEPLGKKLLPVKTRWQAYVFGLVWGWLPCGLVYSVLLWSASAGTAIDSALFMLAFGLGTLPTLLGAGIVSGWFMRLGRQPAFRKLVGLTIIVLAAMTLVYNLQLAGEPHKHLNPLTKDETR